MRVPEPDEKKNNIIKRVAAALILAAVTAMIIAAADSGKLYGGEFEDAFDNLYAVASESGDGSASAE